MGVPPLWWVCDDHEYSCPWPVCTYDSSNSFRIQKKSGQTSGGLAQVFKKIYLVRCVWGFINTDYTDRSKRTCRLTWDDDNEGGTNPLITMSSSKTPSESKPLATWVKRRVSPVWRAFTKQWNHYWAARIKGECLNCLVFMCKPMNVSGSEWCPLLGISETTKESENQWSHIRTWPSSPFFKTGKAIEGKLSLEMTPCLHIKQ